MNVSNRLLMTALVVCVALGLATAAQAGLIAHWKMDGNANDSAGSYDATLVNSPTFTASPLGQAMQLNGIDQRADVPDMGAYAQLSVSVWVNFQVADYAEAGWVDSLIFVNNASGPSNGKPSFGATNWPDANATGVASVWVKGFGLESRHDLGGGMSKNAWHHLAFTYDKNEATTSHLYIDGVLKDTGTVTGGVDADLTDLGIGGLHTAKHGSLHSWKGLIDDLAVWDEVLSPEAIGTIYTNGLAGIAVPEPSTASMILLFGAAMLLYRRRRA